MEKRGQFYLLVAFAIILVILGFRVAYTSVNAVEEGIPLENFASEIVYEGRSIIEHGVFINSSTNDIAQELETIVYYYENRYPGLMALLIYSDGQENYIISREGSSQNTGQNVSVSLADLDQEFALSSGKPHFIVWLASESENERRTVVRGV